MERIPRRRISITIHSVQEDISHLQEVKAALTTKLNTLLEDHKDRQILINKLYAITTRELGPANGQEGSSLDNPSPAGHGASSSNGNGKLPQQLGLASDTARMEEELVRKATLNYSRRQRLKKPGCFLLRSSPGKKTECRDSTGFTPHNKHVDGCKFGDTCAESHDVIPYGYCRQFNDTGRCAVPDCKEKHRLYDFVPTAEEWKRDYHEGMQQFVVWGDSASNAHAPTVRTAVKVTAEPDGKGRKEGARRDRSSSSESSSDRRRRGNCTHDAFQLSSLVYHLVIRVPSYLSERKDDRSRNGRDSRESSRRTGRNLGLSCLIIIRCMLFSNPSGGSTHRPQAQPGLVLVLRSLPLPRW